MGSSLFLKERISERHPDKRQINLKISTHLMMTNRTIIFDTTWPSFHSSLCTDHIYKNKNKNRNGEKKVIEEEWSTVWPLWLQIIRTNAHSFSPVILSWKNWADILRAQVRQETSGVYVVEHALLIDNSNEDRPEAEKRRHTNLLSD